MKKAKLILCILIAVIIIAVIITLVLTNKPGDIINVPKEAMHSQEKITNIPSFDYNLYEKSINEFAISNINVGSINGAETAKEKADKFINDYFVIDVKEGKQLLVYYNEDKDLWFIQSFKSDLSGGFYDVVLNSKGDVLATWHSE